MKKKELEKKEWEKQFWQIATDNFPHIHSDYFQPFLELIDSLLLPQKKGENWRRGYNMGYSEAEWEVKKKILEAAERLKKDLKESVKYEYFNKYTAKEAYELALSEVIKELKK